MIILEISIVKEKEKRINKHAHTTKQQQQRQTTTTTTTTTNKQTNKQTYDTLTSQNPFTFIFLLMLKKNELKT
jgi:hypothetical protein